ncbi:hypothetical protein JCM15519_01940 [Fundidesulfovibrio butyratiphilus]
MRNPTIRFERADLDAVLAGQKAAWDRYVENYAGIIYSVALRLLRMRTGVTDQDEARDITQDVFLKLVKDNFRLLATFDPSRASMSTWLTVVTRSTAMDHLRKPLRRFETVPLDEELPDRRDDVADGLPDIPQSLLSDRQRQILDMLYAKDMDVAEVALALGVQAQTVRSLKHQALTRLRRHFGQEVETELEGCPAKAP